MIREKHTGHREELDPKLVIAKAGSSLTVVGAEFNTDFGLEVARDAYAARELGIQVPIVTSGATALGYPSRRQDRSILRLEGEELEAYERIKRKADAAAGQPILMRGWEEVFRELDMEVSQILIGPQMNGDLRAVIEDLRQRGIVPIINSNDSILPPNSRYWDNDNTGGDVTKHTGAEGLVLMSGHQVTDEEHVPLDWISSRRVDVLELIKRVVLHGKSPDGTGGMGSKIEVATDVQRSHPNRRVAIVNGNEPGVLLRFVRREQVGTTVSKHRPHKKAS